MNGLLCQVDELCFAYPEQDLLLDRLSFTLDSHERVLLRGENGCGKSTLLYLLLGLLKPGSGRIRLAGEDPSDQSVAVFRDLIYCRQSARADLFGLIPRHDLEAWQLAFPQRFTEEAVRGIDDPVIKSLDAVYTSLSGGELRACSLLWLPLLQDKFWLLDEPTAGLDSSRKERFARLCADKAGTGSGMLIISHDPVLPESLFDRVLLLEKGKLRELK